jgi:acyl carrier protein
MSAPFAPALALADAPSSDHVTARVQEIIGNVLAREPVDLTPDRKLMDDLGADGLDMIEIAIEVETAFDIGLTDEAVEDIVTVGDVSRAVTAALAVAGRPVAEGSA